MPVQETQHAPSLPRGVASETPVGRVAVAEDSRNAGKRPVSGRSDTRTCLTDTCGGDGRGRRPIINRSDTRPCHRDACSVGDRVRIGQNYRKVAVLTPACHARWPQRPLWSRMPWQKAVRRPFCHATMALRHLWRGYPWQRRTSKPGKGWFETVLPRDHGSETPLEGVPVAEGRFKGGLPRDHGSEATVAGVPVAEEGKSPERRP